MKSDIISNNLGYPRIGELRELKKATESYWQGQLSQEELLKTGADLRSKNWKKQKEAGIDLIPSNDFSFYDQMLDLTCLVGNVPPRFEWDGNRVDLDTFFHIARGQIGKAKAFASEMTKWFDTNYHYITPEFQADTNFKLASTKVFDQFKEALDLGIKTKPVLIGPITYLFLGKVKDDNNPDFNRFELFDKLIPVYAEVLKQLAALGAEWIQIDEPVLALDLPFEVKSLFLLTYNTLVEAAGSSNILLASYFGDLRYNFDTFLSLPVKALHFDALRGAKEVDRLLSSFPSDKILSLGVVDGRNIWKNDFKKSLDLLKKAKDALGEKRVMVASSCSLMHSPVTLLSEQKLSEEIKNWLAFADQKLGEINALRGLLAGNDVYDPIFKENQQAIASRVSSKRIHNDAVKQRASAVKESDYHRPSPFTERQKCQHAKLNLPLFPTTTIGSFPQTKEVRSMRAQNRKGILSDADYDKLLEQEIATSVAFQEEIDIDMLVHGEFERNDMVEYFGEQLEGFTFTKFGWVQSYGTRCVKPPIIYGDVSRPAPMTVRWSKYAQSLTKRPMKGMLTGPITILQWSFVRDDQPRSETAKQIALAIRDEVVDLETAGIAAIQIDEAAIREGLPLRRDDWAHYLEWAVRAFRLCASGVKNDTQIHTHMCYSEFNDIIDSIADMDADVISIETSRSDMELLDAFVEFKYPNEIGPGVYDIHSPRIPEVSEMENLLKKADSLLSRRNIWVNPDCGLKTRGWKEVKPSLGKMVIAAKKLREESSEEEASCPSCGCGRNH